MYSDYFVWTVLRNPWTRAVSSYRMLSRYMKRECKVCCGGGSRRAAACPASAPACPASALSRGWH